MKMKLIFRFAALVLFFLTEAESLCLLPLTCNSQPGWHEVSLLCSSLTNQSSFNTAVEGLESKVKDLWVRFRHLNDFFLQMQVIHSSVQSNKTEEGETTRMPSGVGDARSGCETSFTFTEDRHKDYVRFNGTVPTLDSFTACAWVSPLPGEQQLNGTLISYCVGNTSNCNSLVLIYESTKVELRIEGEKLALGNLPVTTRTHVCIVKSMADEKIYFYYNGTEQTQKQIDKKISGGGVLIIGQDQDGSLKGNSIGRIRLARDGFTGVIEDFYLWNRTFTSQEITATFESPCSCPADAAISFTSTTSIISGDVIGNYSISC